MKTLLILLLSTLTISAATTSEIVVRDITWQFDDDVEFGQFVNGDYWVVAPVTVTNMLPEWDGTYHGWEINPLHESAQGFTTEVNGFNSAKRPPLPLNIATNASLVKTKGGAQASSHSEIESAEVLTVLEEAPPNGGTNYFRPPYAGHSKPLYQVSDLQTNLMPSLSSVGVTSVPTLEDVEADFSECLRMDHNPSRARQLRPGDAMGDYMPENTAELNNALLRLMLDDPLEDKMPALIMFAQHALDRAYIIQMGYRHAGTGHNPNQRILAAWGAVMFDIGEIKTYMTTADGFHEDRFLWMGTEANIALWGQSNSELRYWEYVGNQGGNRANRDPYGYIDGGKGGSDYLIITAQSMKGSALVAQLFPELQVCFPSERLSTLMDFAERWVTVGRWTLPDPAAPYDGTWGNYGITFGPDGAGGFHENGGRFPAVHGGSTDGGQYKSSFVASMWDNHFEGDPSPGTLSLSASSYSVGEEDGTVTITVTRTGGTVGAVGVTYATSDNSASTGSDYTGTTNTLSWDDEESGAKTFDVTILQDMDEEGNETFFVTLSNPTGDATLGATTSASVTIVDDDGGNPIPLMADLGPFNAEAGLIEGLFQTSGGTVFQTSQTLDPLDGGLARWRVTIPETGNYKVTMDVDAPGTASDSFFVQFDEEPIADDDIWDIQTLTDGVEARDVTLRGTGGFDSPEFNPMVWNLEAGEHTLYVRGREANTEMDTVTISAVGGLPPNAPTGLSVILKESAVIDLEWTDNASDESGFRIERADSASAFEYEEISTVSANETTFEDAETEAGQEYFYRVRAFNASGNSAYTEDGSVYAFIGRRGRATPGLLSIGVGF